MGRFLQFENRAAFRVWLSAHHSDPEGFWMLLGKKGGPKTLTAGDALEEALCFGWIDGQMRSLNEHEYLKYFAQRRKKSRWSQKNMTLIEKLREHGLMTQAGEAAVEAAKQNGMWDLPENHLITAQQVEMFAHIIEPYEPAYSNFRKMSPSAQKNYIGSYFSTRTQDGRNRMLEKIIARLHENKKPM